MPVYFIYSFDEELFWSNDLGWVDFSNADKYDEKFETCLVGNWAWIKI